MVTIIDKVIGWLNNIFDHKPEDKPIDKEMRCAYCKKPGSQFVEKAPDGPNEPFCSVDHYRKFVSEAWAQGTVWRSMGLMDITTGKYVQDLIVLPKSVKEIVTEIDVKKDIAEVSKAIGTIKPLIGEMRTVIMTPEKPYGKEKPTKKYIRYPVKCRDCGKHTRTTDKETAAMAKTKNNFTCWNCSKKKK